MQTNPDGGYISIMKYKNMLTNFISLRPLKTKHESEVADHLLDIFCDKGIPHVFYIDSDEDFAKQVNRSRKLRRKSTLFTRFNRHLGY